MSIDAMKQALEALESYHGYMEPLTTVFGGPKVPAEQSTTGKVEKAITALRLAIEQAEKQEPDDPLVNIELSQRMAAVKVGNFYGSIIRDAEKEIERLHGLVLQHTTPPQRRKT